jgi:hypothetical protein
VVVIVRGNTYTDKHLVRQIIGKYHINRFPAIAKVGKRLNPRKTFDRYTLDTKSYRRTAVNHRAAIAAAFGTAVLGMDHIQVFPGNHRVRDVIAGRACPQHHTHLGPVIAGDNPLDTGRDKHIAADFVVGKVELVVRTGNIGSAAHDKVLLGQRVILPDMTL